MMMEGYGGNVFNTFQDIATSIPALVKAYQVLDDFGGYTAEKARYLASAQRSYVSASLMDVYDSYALELAAFKAEQNEMARKFYNKGSEWEIPYNFMVRDMLPFIWSCTGMYEITGDSSYLDKAAEFADRIAERQFADWENPLDNCYGTFYEWEGDDEALLVEHHQHSAFHLGATVPANLQGLIELLKHRPDDPKAAKWYNVVKTYVDNWVKKTADINPFKIYPVAGYKDPVHGGVMFFKVYAHGSMGGHHGTMGKNLMQLGDFLNDSSLQELANDNVNFVVGLNPGHPTAYIETEWNAISMIKGVGVNFWDRPAMGGYPVVAANAENGSGFNGYSAYAQFDPGYLADAPDAPAGILTPSGSYYFNEDWIVHSHAYVQGVAKVEGEFVLDVSTSYNGLAVIADVDIDLTENALPNAALAYNYATDVNGELTLNDLPVQTAGTISVTYNGKVISKHIEPIASGSFACEIDFADCVYAAIDTPQSISLGKTKTAQITLTNHGDTATTANVTLSADGVTLGTSQYSEPLAAGQTKVKVIDITAGSKVKPYLLYARVTSGSNIEIAIGDGKVTSLLANLNDTDNIVNYLDFALLASEWMEPGPGLLYDIDGGGVDMSDLQIMADEWLLGIEF